MKHTETVLFEILRTALFDNSVKPQLPLSIDSWQELHKAACMQKLWPLVFEEVAGSPEYAALPPEIQTLWMQEALASVSRQVRQSEELHKVCTAFCGKGIKYVILKGISCRRYYPNPDLRPSGDEDILIDWRDYKECDDLLKNMGYVCEENFGPDDVGDKREAHYESPDGALCLEVHFNAIGKENERQRRLNNPFDDALSHTVTAEYENYTFAVLEPTYQIMHLLSHLYRHLFEAGVGVRQMIDVLLTIRAENKNINWRLFADFLESTKTGKVFGAVLDAGERYFAMDLSEIPGFIRSTADSALLLEDMLDGGIYGYGENGERKLLENFTLDVDTGHSSAWQVIFPAMPRLSNRYPVLDKHPWLYPIFAVARWFELLFFHTLKRSSRENLKEQAAAGKKRKEMLEKYRG